MTLPKRDTRNKGVTRSMVAAAAAALLADGGLERLSMRRVAVHLGVTPMALYNHVQSKDDLLAVLADHLRGSISVDEALPPRDQLVSLLLQLRDLGSQHPALLEPTSEPAPSRHAAALALLQLRLLDELGLAPHQVRVAYQGLVLVVAGSAVVWRARAHSPGTTEHLKNLIRDEAGEQDRARLAALDALPEQTADEVFVMAVDQVLRAAAVV